MNIRIKKQIDDMSLGYMKKFWEYQLQEGFLSLHKEWRNVEIKQYFLQSMKEKENRHENN